MSDKKVFNKPPLTVEQQLFLLKERRLLVKDQQAALQVLSAHFKQ